MSLRIVDMQVRVSLLRESDRFYLYVFVLRNAMNLTV